jgi:hypothetical protein
MNGLVIGAIAFCFNKFCYFFDQPIGIFLEFFCFSIVDLTIFAHVFWDNPPNLRFKFKKKP